MKRILIAPVIILTLTTVLFAQKLGQRGIRPAGPPPNADGSFQPRDPLSNLKTALNLTDSQVTAIQALLQTRQERSKTIMDDINAKRQAFEALVNAASPDPTAVGNAAIALNAAQKGLASERDWYITELKKLLTGDQQATLDSLIAAGTPIPGLGGPGGFGGPRGGMRGPRPGGF
jgi:Spy/CpxP family protein refolding chaperone